jgi:hypothetical protein
MKKVAGISGVYFDLVWTLRGYRDGKIKDMILPLEQYIKNNKEYKLPKVNHIKMLKYRELTLKHLKKGILQAKRLGIWKPFAK